jgi:hypothetical protein
MKIQRIQLTISTENAAFEDGWDAAVEDVIDQTREWLTRVRSETVGEDEGAISVAMGGDLFDVNGNRIGEIAIHVE